MSHWTLFLTALVAILVAAFIVPSIWNSTIGAAVPSFKL